MLIFISGGVRSGKSTLGEKIADEISHGGKVYLATSKIYDEEMLRRIIKHKTDRRDSGFKTIEKSRGIAEIAHRLKTTDTVLLDCLTTLTANEMFSYSKKSYDDAPAAQAADKIYSDIMKINGAAANLIIVSNEIFSDGRTYDPATERYIEVMGLLHIKIAEASDTAIECAYGSQIVHKGKPFKCMQ